MDQLKTDKTADSKAVGDSHTDTKLTLEHKAILERYERIFKEKIEGKSESKYLVLDKALELLNAIKDGDKKAVQRVLNDLEVASRRFKEDFDDELRFLLIHCYAKGIGVEKDNKKALIYLRPLGGFLPTADAVPGSLPNDKIILTERQRNDLESCVLELEDLLIKDPESPCLMMAYKLINGLKTKEGNKELNEDIQALERNCPSEKDVDNASVLFLLAMIYKNGIRIAKDENKYQSYLNRCSKEYQKPASREINASLRSICTHLPELVAWTDAAKDRAALEQKMATEDRIKILAALDKESEQIAQEMERKLTLNSPVMASVALEKMKQTLMKDKLTSDQFKRLNELRREVEKEISLLSLSVISKDSRSTLTVILHGIKKILLECNKETIYKVLCSVREQERFQLEMSCSSPTSKELLSFFKTHFSLQLELLNQDKRLQLLESLNVVAEPEIENATVERTEDEASAEIKDLKEENTLFHAEIEKVRNLKFDEKYVFIFSDWGAKKRPEACKAIKSITLTGNGLKLLQDNLDNIKIKGKLTKELIESLYNLSEEKMSKDREIEQEHAEKARRSLYLEFCGLPDKWLKDYGTLGKLQNEVNDLLSRIKHSIGINEKLIEDDHYKGGTSTKRKEKIQSKLKSLKREVDTEKFDAKFDAAFQTFREKYDDEFQPRYAAKVALMRQASEVHNLKEMEGILSELKGTVKELEYYLNAMKKAKEDLLRIKRDLDEQQQNFFENVEQTKAAELKVFNEDKAKKKDYNLWLGKQIKALKDFEAKFEKMNVEREKQRQADQLYAEDRKRWKEDYIKQKDAAREHEATKQREREALRQMNEFSAGTAGKEIGSDDSDVKHSKDNGRPPKAAPPLTLDRAGAIGPKISESERKRAIDQQLQEGRVLITQIMEEQTLEIKTYALLGKFGQMLESMKQSRTLDDKPTPLAIVAKFVRNTVFHGEADFIPNVEQKLIDETKAIQFLEQLKAVSLELLTTDWQKESSLTTVKLPELFARMAFYRVQDKPIDFSKYLTLQAIHAFLLQHTSNGKRIIKHTKENCIKQLTMYTKGLETIKKQKIQHAMVQEHAIGYLKARISTYMMHLKWADDSVNHSCYKEWLKNIEPLDIKLGALYRHNAPPPPPVILSEALKQGGHGSCKEDKNAARQGVTP